MKKVIFISALAIAAAVSCTKSDIVDTKFNEQISFENYIGRDAMTKAAVVNKGNIGTAGIYGFYTAGADWSEGSTANLWVNDPLLCSAGTVTPAKYWTNEKDKYTFFAYAPKATETNGLVASVKSETVTEVKDPVVTYTVPTNLKDQIDLTYAQVKNTTKEAVDAAASEKVDMTFKHALARLTVKAASAENQEFKFDVKEINIVGDFVTEGTLKLSDNSWTATANDEASETYVFHRNVVEVEKEDGTKEEVYAVYSEANALPVSPARDYAGSDNYLMMIPVNFATTPATVTVKYTTFYAGQESTVNTATFTVNTNFEQGKAYSINLTFSKDVEAIQFNVSVEDWKPWETDENGNVVENEDGSHNTVETPQDKEIEA